MIAEVTAWSMRVCASGMFPTTGFNGEQFEKNTYRYKLQGKPIAGEWVIFGRNIVVVEAFNDTPKKVVESILYHVVFDDVETQGMLHEYESRLESPQTAE